MSATPLASSPVSAGACSPAALGAPDWRASTEWVLSPHGERLAITDFQLGGLYCAACTSVVEGALRGQPGVHQASAQAATAHLRLHWFPDQVELDAVLRPLQALGYQALPATRQGAQQARQQAHRDALWRLFVAVFLMMQVMMLATPAYLSGPEDLAPDLERLLVVSQWVLSVPVMLFSAGPFFRQAWAQCRQGRIGMDTPVALALAITFVASSAVVADPGGPWGREVYFDSLTMFVSFLLASRYLALRTRHRVEQALEQASAAWPEHAERWDSALSVWRRVPSTVLQSGDVIRVAPGQAFAADGVLCQGRSAVDERFMSGESTPIPKAVGDEVWAGSLNLQASVQVRVSRMGEDTRWSGIERLMRQAMASKPQAVAAADAFAPWFLWGVLLLAAGGAAVWSVWEPHRALWVAVSVLVVTCPCALSLAAPSAWLSAAGRLAREGLLLSRLDALDRLSSVSAVVFDKTGTLSDDGLRFKGHLPPVLPPATLEQARQMAAVSTHPYARALLRDLAAPQPDPAVAPAPQAALQDVEEVPGQGLQATDAQGRIWRLGRPAWVFESQALLPRWAEDAPDAPACQVALVCHSPSDGEVLQAAGFLWQESLREGATEVVAALAARGLRLHLWSGDQASRVHALASRLPSAVAARYGQAPQSKWALLQGLQAQGEFVCVVGDGVNDAPMLAQADVAVAMGQGSAMTQKQADLVLVAPSMAPLVLAFELAQATRRVVRRNLMWSAAYNAACIPLALLGHLPPWAAGLGMAASSALVLAHSASLLRFQSGPSMRAEPAPPARQAAPNPSEPATP